MGQRADWGKENCSRTLAENILHNPGIGCPHFEMPTSEAPEKNKLKIKNKLTNSGDVRQPMGTPVDLSKTRATFWVAQWVVVIIQFVGPVKGSD